LLPGPQFVVYLALWVLMPKRPYPAATWSGQAGS